VAARVPIDKGIVGLFCATLYMLRVYVAVAYVSFAIGGAILIIAVLLIIVLIIRHRSHTIILYNILFSFLSHWSAAAIQFTLLYVGLVSSL